MKYALALTAALLATACVTGSEVDQDRAYAKCEGIKTVTVRDRCFAEALAQSQRERNDQAEKMQESNDRAEERELGRVIAGAEQN